MAYTEKFQTLADQAQANVAPIDPSEVDTLLAQGAIALDIRDKEEHDAGRCLQQASRRWGMRTPTTVLAV